MEDHPKDALLDFLKLMDSKVSFVGKDSISVILNEKIARELDEPYKLDFNLDEFSPENPFFGKIKNYCKDRGNLSSCELKIDIDKDLKNVKPIVTNSKSAILNVEDKTYPLLKFNFKVLFNSAFEKNEEFFSVIINPSTNDFIENTHFDTLNPVINEHVGKLQLDNTSILYKKALDKLEINSSSFIEEKKSELLKNFKRKIREIEEHYNQALCEADEEAEDIKKKIQRNEKKLDKLVVKKDIQQYERRIREQEKQLNDLETESYAERLEKEKKGKFKEQEALHKPEIVFSLVNAQVMYVPNKVANIQLVRGKMLKNVQITYDPIKKKVAHPFCELCGKEVREGFLDDHNRYICTKCVIECKLCNKKCSNDDFIKCPSCGHEMCKECFKKDLLKCSECNKKVCSECFNKCSVCDKALCKEHAHKCHESKQVICSEHVVKCHVCKKEFSTKRARKCQGCSKLVCKDDLKECPRCGSRICEKCVRWKNMVFGLIQSRRCVRCEDK